MRNGSELRQSFRASRAIPVATGENNRLFVEAVLWLARTGAPGRDLPAEFGNWNSIFRRFRRWAKSGVWSRILEVLIEDPDLEHLIIDATIVRAHQHAAGAKGGVKIRRSGARAVA
jgi:putative transposase